MLSISILILAVSVLAGALILARSLKTMSQATDNLRAAIGRLGGVATTIAQELRDLINNKPDDATDAQDQEFADAVNAISDRLEAAGTAATAAGTNPTGEAPADPSAPEGDGA